MQHISFFAKQVPDLSELYNPVNKVTAHRPRGRLTSDGSKRAHSSTVFCALPDPHPLSKLCTASGSFTSCHLHNSPFWHLSSRTPSDRCDSSPGEPWCSSQIGSYQSRSPSWEIHPFLCAPLTREGIPIRRRKSRLTWARSQGSRVNTKLALGRRAGLKWRL